MRAATALRSRSGTAVVMRMRGSVAGWLARPRRAPGWSANYRIYLGSIVGLAGIWFFGLAFVLEPVQPEDRWWGWVLFAGAVLASLFFVLHLRRPVAGRPHRGLESEWGPKRGGGVHRSDG